MSLQRLSTIQAEPMTAPPIVSQVLCSAGQPLDRITRAFQGSRFGHDFSRVRIHTDAKAAKSARAIGALAYTLGPHVVFAVRRYAPGTAVGDRLLAHELAHTIQQRASASPSPSALVISPPADDLEQEAERAAETVVAREAARVQSRAEPARLHRQLDPDVPGVSSNMGPPFEEVPQPPICSVGWKDGSWFWKCENVPGLGSTPEVPLDPRRIPEKLKELIPKPKGDDKSLPPWLPPPRLPSPGGLVPGMRLPQEAWDSWLKDECKCFPAICKPQLPGLGPAPGPLGLSLGSSRAAASLSGSLTLDGFDVNRSELTPQHTEKLDDHAKVLSDLLRRYPDSFISIVGHTDAPGKEVRNRELSKQRADTVLSSLIARGISAEAMSATGLGQTALKVESKTYEPRNRRVEIYFNARRFFGPGTRQ